MLKIFHLDAGRKFYSVPVIKGIIDTLAKSGFEYLELYVSDNQGFRFALPDRMVKTKFGTYDLTKALGDGYCQKDSHPSGCGQYLTSADFEELLSYARAKGIDIIPGFEMPGHMGTILQQFPQFRYPGSNSSLNLQNEEAVAFVMEILKMHASYFANLGCKYYLLGADEYANDLEPSDDPNEFRGMGFERIYRNGEMSFFVNFMNEAIQVICGFGLIPMVFNDGVCYHNDNTTYGEVDKRALVCYWIRGWMDYNLASVPYLLEHGYQVINTHCDYYLLVGCEDWSKPLEKAATFDPHVYAGNPERVEHPAGCMECLWSDRGDYDGQDDGVTVAGHIKPIIEVFGKAMLDHE